MAKITPIDIIKGVSGKFAGNSNQQDQLQHLLCKARQRF